MVPERKFNVAEDRVRLLLNIATAVSQSLDPKEVAESALWSACTAVQLDVGMVLFLNQQQRIILASQGFSLKWLHAFRSTALDLQGTIIEQTLTAGQPKAFSDLRVVPNDDVVQLFRIANLSSLICLPLQVLGNVPGILLIGSQMQRNFEPDEIDLLETVAGQISTGLRNAWLFTQSQRQLEQLEAVNAAAQAVVSSRDADQILVQILETVTERLRSEVAVLWLLDEVHEELEVAALAGPAALGLKESRIRVGQGTVGWVAQHGQPLLIPDVSKDDRYSYSTERRTSILVSSVLCVPLRAKEQLIGVVQVINKRQGQFSQGDQRMLEVLANFAAIAIENARQYTELKRQIDQSTLYAQDLATSYKEERRQSKALQRLRYSFLNVVGHELKTPLTVIAQGLETLKGTSQTALPPEQVETVSMLEEQAAYLSRMIDGVTTFASFSAKQQKLSFTDVPFEAALDEALALARFKSVNKQIEIVEHKLTPLPILSMDKQRMAEAIAQLIDNAVKYSPPEGTVTVKAQRTEDTLSVAIIDQGSGIPPDELDKIWDSFTQMNTSMIRGLEGLGLGLAIARYIVEAHNGTIVVNSELGQGSIFTVELPCQ